LGEGVSTAETLIFLSVLGVSATAFGVLSLALSSYFYFALGASIASMRLCKPFG
jgi:hypothetical protein